MENEYELKRFVLSTAVTRIHCDSLCAFMLDRLSPPLRLYKRGRSSPENKTDLICSVTTTSVVPLAAAVAGDSIPSSAYTADGRAGLRNPASPDPVRERGD